MMVFKKARELIHTGNLVVLFAYFGKTDFRVLHVGAHLGQESEIYSKFSVDDVYWVEPQLSAIKHMKSKFPMFRIIPFAVWSANKTLKLQIAENEVSSSIFPIHPLNPFQIGQPIGSQEVQAVTLDYIILNHLPLDEKPLLIVLDIQGAELEALKGLDLLKNSNVIGLVVEVSKKPVYIGGATYEEIRNSLALSGFKKSVGFVYPPTYHGDELFLRFSTHLNRSLELKMKLVAYLNSFMHWYYRYNKRRRTRNFFDL